MMKKETIQSVAGNAKNVQFVSKAYWLSSLQMRKRWMKNCKNLYNHRLQS